MAVRVEIIAYSNELWDRIDQHKITSMIKDDRSEPFILEMSFSLSLQIEKLSFERKTVTKWIIIFYLNYRYNHTKIEDETIINLKNNYAYNNYK